MTNHAHAGLYAVEGHTFCGPTALAALTGLPPPAIEAAIIASRVTLPPYRPNRLSPRWRALGVQIKTVWSNEIVPVVSRLGWTAHEAYPPSPYGGRRPTLAAWLREHRDSPDAWLVLVTGHYVAVRAGLFVDTQYRSPIAIARAPCKHRRVVRAWRLTEGLDTWL